MVAMSRSETKTVVLGPANLKIEIGKRLMIGGLELATFDRRDSTELGGSAILTARANLQAGGASLITGLITGQDDVGGFLIDLAARELPDVRRISTANFTDYVRTCFNDPGRVRRESHLQFHSAATIADVVPLLDVSTRLVIAGMPVESSLMVQSLSEMNPGSTCLLVSSSQGEDRASTMPLVKRCSLVVLSGASFQSLSGNHDVVRGIDSFVDEGGINVIINNREHGIRAFIDGDWHHQSAFFVERKVRSGNSDEIILGTFLAARDQGRSVHTALKLAAAADAMNQSNVKPRSRGLADLAAFAANETTGAYFA